jgi:hypothetical protein
MARVVSVEDTGLGVSFIAVPDTTNGGDQAREKADQRGNETGRKNIRRGAKPFCWSGRIGKAEICR